MQKNVGGVDRIARLIVGPVLLVAGIAGYAGLLTVAVGPFPQALTSVALVLVGTILLVTGAVQRCPLNRLFGLNTYRRRDTREPDTAKTPTRK